MTIEELQKQLEQEQAKTKALESSNARLVDESKTNKTRAQDAEAKITETEKAKLIEQGKTDELLVAANEENAKLKTKIATTTKLTLKEKLRTEIGKHAKDAHDVDMVLKVIDHKDLLTIDEDNLTVEGGEAFVGKVRETHSFLFKKQNLNNGDGKTPPKDDGKTDDEKYYAELDGANTRLELDAVKKKYGKK